MTQILKQKEDKRKIGKHRTHKNNISDEISASAYEEPNRIKSSHITFSLI